MAENAYLDGAGVAQLWDATKDYVASHAAQPEVTSGTEDEAAWLTRETAAGFPCGGRATVKAIKGHSEVVDGSLVSAHPTGIESEDADGNALGGISIPIAQLKPEGLRSAGSVADELTADALVTRVGSVKMNEVTWLMAAAGIFYLNDTKLPDLRGSNSGICVSCEVYEPVASVDGAGTMANRGDMTIATGTISSPRLYVHDTRYSTADAFNAATTDALIHYPLATPTTVTIDPPLNFTYRCEAGGTETVTHTEATSAPTLDVVYEIDNMAAAASIAPLEGRIASTNYALGALIMLGGTLVKVTTAIATGEQIILGQNVTATTVAAELAALA